MKTLKKHIGLAGLLLLGAACVTQPLSAQGGLFVSSGTQVVASGSPFIVIDNGRWSNDGTFAAATSTVLMTGNATTANSTIGGTSSTTFYNLTQQKSANNIQLMQNIGVDGNFTMAGGLFQLNNFVVTLGTASGQIVGESEVNRITGTTGGEIWKTMVLNAPAGVNPGNMGATITSAANLGSTKIERGHVRQTDGNSGISIFRYYDIIPTNNTGLGATLRQGYFDAELGGIVESELEHFSSLNGGLSWYWRGFSSRNTTTNVVDNNSYGDLSTRFTLASRINQPLPVVFLDEGLRCEEEGATLFWLVNESPGGDYFQVEKSDDEAVWEDVAGARLASQGVGRHRYEYALDESAPFFRIRQVDVGGATLFSDAHRLTCNLPGEWLVWPNPASGTVNFQAPYANGIEAIELVDMLGQVIWRDAPSGAAWTTYQLELREKVAAGSYMLRIQPTSGNVVIKKLYVQR